MSKPDTRMDYGMMESMSESFRSASKQLEETMSAMKQIAGQLEGGALQGKTGDAMVSALRSDLQRSLQLLKEKMDELAGDVDGAVVSMRDGVAEAKSRFL